MAGKLTGPYIDIHAHILPGFDDGPETVEDSIQMARAYVEAGYAAVIATPHVIPGVYENTRGSILRGVKRLQQSLDDAGIPLSVLPGAEYHLTDLLVPLLKAGELLTLNDTGKYLLVELPGVDVPAYASQVLFELLLASVTPIIAHPERNGFLVRRHEALADMCSKGVLAQVTAGALTGLFGTAQKRACEKFIEDGTAQFLATDAHSPGWRLQAGAEAAKLLGAKGSELMYEHPAAVINGAVLEAAACREGARFRSRRFNPPGRRS
ncbi:MAG: CpsB/CapC family capsule biosynthesis tyrosine phosphatase [Bacillota bacterium]